MAKTENLDLLLTTTPTVEGRQIRSYLGVVTGQAILGANFVKDIFAGVRDVVGGRAGAYEHELATARDLALNEIAAAGAARGADAVVAIDLDYETVGQNGSMLMVTAAGTAVSFHVDEPRLEVEWQHGTQLVPAT